MPNAQIAQSATPITSSRALGEARLATSAPSGAAITPPISSPAAADVNTSHPRVAMNAAEIVTVTKNSATMTVPTTLRGTVPWTRRLLVTIGPSLPPRCIEKPARQVKWGHEPWRSCERGASQRPPDDVKRERAEIGENDWPRELGVHLGQRIGSDRPAENSGQNEAPEQPPVDLAMGNVARAGGRRREAFDDMHARRRGRRGNAKADQQGAGDQSECHAEGAVDELGGEADANERQQLEDQ